MEYDKELCETCDHEMAVHPHGKSCIAYECKCKGFAASSRFTDRSISLSLFADEPPYETTGLHNDKYRTFVPPGNPIGNGSQTFNRLAPMPLTKTYLPNGVYFGIQVWKPNANKNCWTYGILEIEIKAVLIGENGYCDGYSSSHSNPIAQCPEQPIDFGDGRELVVKKWNTHLQEGHSITAHVEGFIRFKS
jgi:hypothetical protein